MNTKLFNKYEKEIKELKIKKCEKCSCKITPLNYGVLGVSPEGKYSAYCFDCINKMNKKIKN